MSTCLVVMANDNQSLMTTMFPFSRKVPDCFGTSFLICAKGSDIDEKSVLDYGFDHVSFIEGTVSALNIAREHVLVNRDQDPNLMIVRSGTTVALESIEQMVEAAESQDCMMMATVLDPGNGNLELTHEAAGAVPVPQFKKGERSSGIDDSWWLDGPVMFFSYDVLEAVGAFDLNDLGSYALIDYSVRARWMGYKTLLNHDCGIRFVNEKPFNIVFKGREQEMFLLSKHNFERKYGGSILQTLTQ